MLNNVTRGIQHSLPEHLLDRDGFEKFISSSPYEKSISRYPNSSESAWAGCYRDINVHLAFDCWRESRLKMAAQVPCGTNEVNFSEKRTVNDTDNDLFNVRWSKESEILNSGALKKIDTTSHENIGNFQDRVLPWLIDCFGEEIAGDKQERCHRLLEEALELIQSCGSTAFEAHQLVDYVFSRPVGVPSQEVGGVMVTLAALCLANNLNMHESAEIELSRVWTNVEEIREKQERKPSMPPLPGVYIERLPYTLTEPK